MEAVLNEQTLLRMGFLRKQLVDFTVSLFAYSCFIVVPLFYWRHAQEREIDFHVAQYLPFIIFVSLLALHFCKNKLEPTTRAIWLSVLLLVCAVAGLVSRGILGPAFCFMLMAIFSLSLILPLRKMLVAASLIFAVNIMVVFYHFSGGFAINIDPVQAFEAPASWVSYFIVPVYASALIIFSFSRFNTTLINILEDLEKEKSNVAYLANHDPLTGLPNIRVMEIRAEQALEMAKRNQASPAILFIDLDHFKMINDNFGHEVGDILLKEASHRIQAILRGGDTVIRNGGDEFLVLLTHYNNTDGLVLVAERICSALAKPFMIDNIQCDVSCSIGIAYYPDHGTDLQTLIEKADTAMYTVKRSGKNGVKLHTLV